MLNLIPKINNGRPMMRLLTLTACLVLSIFSQVDFSQEDRNTRKILAAPTRMQRLMPRSDHMSRPEPEVRPGSFDPTFGNGGIVRYRPGRPVPDGRRAQIPRQTVQPHSPGSLDPAFS